MKIVSLTHQGLVRINNEDAVVTDEVSGYVALADGMGGLLAGEEASDIAVTAAAQLLQDRSCAIDTILEAAHERVKAHARSKNYVGKMGTTLVLWRWCDGRPEFCHVGDSRLYSLQGKELVQLTHDHTVAQRMVDEGIIPASEADTAPHQNVLTQAVGMPGMLNPQSGSTPTGGRLLLCSDGLSDLVSLDRICQSMLEVLDLEECARQLVKCALDGGGRDNVTVAIIDLD